jgi:hypothetical protein
MDYFTFNTPKKTSNIIIKYLVTTNNIKKEKSMETNEKLIIHKTSPWSKSTLKKTPEKEGIQFSIFQDLNNIFKMNSLEEKELENTLMFNNSFEDDKFKSKYEDVDLKMNLKYKDLDSKINERFKGSQYFEKFNFENEKNEMLLESETFGDSKEETNIKEIVKERIIKVTERKKTENKIIIIEESIIKKISEKLILYIKQNEKEINAISTLDAENKSKIELTQIVEKIKKQKKEIDEEEYYNEKEKLIYNMIETTLEDIKKLKNKGNVCKILVEITDILKKDNYIEECIDIYEVINKLNPININSWLENIKLNEEIGNFTECIKLIEAGLSYIPHNESLILKGMKLQEQERNISGARNYLAMLQNIPVEKGWKLMLEGALLELRSGNIDKSRILFKYLMNSQPKHGPIFYEAFKLEEKSENYERGKKIIEKGLELNPRYGPLWFEYIRLLEKNNKSLDFIRKIIEKSSKQISKELIWKVYFELSLIEERFGNLKESRLALVNSVIHSLENLRWKGISYSFNNSMVNWS